MVKPSSRSRNSYYSASDDDEKSSQFFKIFIPRHCSKHLRIPPAFIKYFKGVSPSKSVLKTCCAKTSWCIDVNKVGNYFFFQKGWPEFVRDNSLESGDFLIFCYTGNSEFYVPIFGKNNCRKEVPICIRDSDILQPVLQGSGAVEASKSEEIECLNSREEGTKRTVEANVEDASTKFISKHPFFQIVLSPACMRHFLGIPSKFQKSYINEPRATAMLQYSNKRWVVNLITCKDGRLFFSGGWSKFMKQNSLQVGDVCSFELIEKENYVFMVSISRGKSKEIRGLEDAFDKFTSKHPSFHVVLSPSSVSRHLCIPSKFWTSYIDQPKATARLQCSNQWWMVGLRGYGHGSYFLGGWSKFVKENSLQLGDACCFELIEKENYVFKFKVSIARGINNSAPTKA